MSLLDSETYLNYPTVCFALDLAVGSLYFCVASNQTLHGTSTASLTQLLGNSASEQRQTVSEWQIELQRHTQC